MKKFFAALGLCLMSAPAFAATAVNLSSFEGVEEPNIIYLAGSNSFVADQKNFENITDAGKDTVRMTLRYYGTNWWDGDRDRRDRSRQRAEVKGIGPHQKTGETFEYATTWRTSTNFYGSGGFCHIFQLKALNGDNGAPLVTLSIQAGTSNCVVHYWSGNSRGFVPAREFHWKPGVWENVRIRIKTSNTNDGAVLASVNGDAFQGATNVAVYRPNATAYRPKWGLYRGTRANLPLGTTWVEHKDASGTRIAGAPFLARGWEMVPEILARIVPPTFPDRNFVVTDYGAVTNGSKDSLPAFKAAIAACNAGRGGNVIVPAGNYRLDGPVHLLDDVNLHLETNAVLNFTADPKFYLPVVLVKWEGTRCYNYSPLIYAYQKHGVAVTGAGVINGGYSNFWYKWNFKVEASDQKRLEKMGQNMVPVEKRIFGKGHYLRPYGIQFYDCEDVLVDGITMKASPMWSLSPVFCSNVTIRNYKVTPGYYNDDGCDPDSCIDTLIENCDFDTADDNIAIKAGRDNDAWPDNGGRECENLIIRSNYFRATRNNAIAIGSEMSGGVKNVFVEDNTFGQVPKYVVYLKGNTDRGGYIENVWMRNNTGTNTSARVAFQIESGFNSVTNHLHPPLYRDLHFENFTIGRADTGIYIAGLAQQHITNVFFKDITIGGAPNPATIKFTDNVRLDNVNFGTAPAQPPEATKIAGFALTAEAGQTGAPRVFLLEGAHLQAIQKQIQDGDKSYAPAIAALERDAQVALQGRPGSVMDKPCVAPSGDKHDYMSQAPYAWPDPAKSNGLPYLYRDGQRNPEAKTNSDYDAMWKMAWDVETLSLAYYLTGKEPYADKAEQLIKTWFLDPATRMNPNVEYAQRTPGVDKESHGGVIDALAIPLVIDSTGLLAGSPSWTGTDERGLKEWITKYRAWLQESTMGHDESQAQNNHGAYYDVQVVTYSLFLGDQAAARSILENDKQRITRQIEPDGEQPLELARTISLHYSIYNLRALFMLAKLGENVDVDLWNYRTDDGRSISKAIDYLIPCVTGVEQWPHQQISEYPMEKAYTVLRKAPVKYPDQRYRDMVSKFPKLEPEHRDNLLIPKPSN